MRPQTIQQTMEFLPNGARRLAGQLRTETSFDNLWKVLTDYEHLNEFIPNLKSSDLLSRNGNRVRLRQVGEQKILGFDFSAEVFLELIEDRANGTIHFSLVKGDFRGFQGYWNIQKLSGIDCNSLVYDLTVQGAFWMPVRLIEQRLRQDLTTNLLAIEEAAHEIETFK